MNAMRKNLGFKALLKWVLPIVAFAILLFSFPTVALATESLPNNFIDGHTEVDLTWNTVVGFGYTPWSKIQVTIEDSGGVKGIAETTVTIYGDYLILPENITTPTAGGIDIKSGDKITVNATSLGGTLIDRDVINANLSAFISTSLDKIFIESNPEETITISIFRTETTQTPEGTETVVQVSTGTDGKCEYQADFDILPYDYFDISYEDTGGNMVFVHPTAPYGMASLTDDSVWGFFYQPETTVSVEIYSGPSESTYLASAQATTDSDGYFGVSEFSPKIDIKNGYFVVITSGYEENRFRTNLEAEVKFNPGIVKGRTIPGSYVTTYFENPGDPSIFGEKVATATATGSFTMAARPGLKDKIWVSSIHPDGNITQLEIVYGTKNWATGQAVVFADEASGTASNIWIKEIRPASLESTTGSNSITMQILTAGVTFTSPPRAMPFGVGLSNLTADVSEDLKTATWYVSNSTTSTVGNIFLDRIYYNVTTETTSGPVSLRIGGSSGVTTDTISNAMIEPERTSFEVKGTVTDEASDLGIGMATIRVFEDNNLLANTKTNSSGNYSFPALPKGDYEVWVTKIGYTTGRSLLSIEGNTDRDFALKHTDIGVLTSKGTDSEVYEQIQSALNGFNFDVSLILKEDIVDVDSLKGNLKSLFINSSNIVLDDTSTVAIRDFVRSGGSLYTSDMLYELIEHAFPGKVSFLGEDSWVSTGQTIEANVRDNGLADYLNLAPSSSINLNFSDYMVPWVVINGVSSDVDVYVSGDINVGAESVETLSNKPLAVGFKEGQGRVIYTSYYLNPTDGAVDENGRKLLNYLVLSTIMGQEINYYKDMLKGEGYDIVKLNVDVLSENASTPQRSFTQLPDNDLLVSLAWQTGQFRLKVWKPDGTLTDSGVKATSPITMAGDKVLSGSWGYAISTPSTEPGIYPYVLAIGARATKQATNTDDDNNQVPDDNSETSNISNGTNSNGTNPSWTIPGGTNSGDGTTPADTDQTDVKGSKVKPEEGASDDPVEINFSDVKEGDWFHTYVFVLADSRIVNGYGDGTFRPTASITRAEFCKMLLTADGQNPSDGENSAFSDTANHWAKGYIQKAKELGWVGGYKDGTFRPNGFITRAEMVKIVCIAEGLEPSTIPSGFTDCKGHWADGYIYTLKYNGYLAGGTKFNPQSKATRAEVSKMIFVLINN